jgi:hypothetical protein
VLLLLVLVVLVVVVLLVVLVLVLLLLVLVLLVLVLVLPPSFWFCVRVYLRWLPQLLQSYACRSASRCLRLSSSTSCSTNTSRCRSCRCTRLLDLEVRALPTRCHIQRGGCRRGVGLLGRYHWD